MVVADGYYDKEFSEQLLEHDYVLINVAKELNWNIAWDPCFERGRGGVPTEECKKYGVI